MVKSSCRFNCFGKKSLISSRLPSKTALRRSVALTPAPSADGTTKPSTFGLEEKVEILLKSTKSSSPLTPVTA